MKPPSQRPPTTPPMLNYQNRAGEKERARRWRKMKRGRWIDAAGNAVTFSFMLIAVLLWFFKGIILRLLIHR